MSLWVFGYGSLLWNPGFTPAETCQARLQGFYRSFCMISVNYRGSPQCPGLVLALDEQAGANCHGMAMRVNEDERGTVLEYLRHRELITRAYAETTVQVQLIDGRRVNALTFVIDKTHKQYVRYALEKQAQMIAKAIGERGHNAEYLHNTAQFLENLNICDPDIKWLSQRVNAIHRNNP